MNTNFQIENGTLQVEDNNWIENNGPDLSSDPDADADPIFSSDTCTSDDNCNEVRVQIPVRHYLFTHCILIDFLVRIMIHMLRLCSYRDYHWNLIVKAKQQKMMKMRMIFVITS